MAAVFHFPLAELMNLDLAELVHWHDQAIRIHDRSQS
ncbi:MAG: GpE family phage tail protein [Caulobacter sp.]|nr:GpE family phage tail protein [Caulobacter sp.]